MSLPACSLGPEAGGLRHRALWDATGLGTLSSNLPSPLVPSRPLLSCRPLPSCPRSPRMTEPRRSPPAPVSQPEGQLFPGCYLLSHFQATCRPPKSGASKALRPGWGPVSGWPRVPSGRPASRGESSGAEAGIIFINPTPAVSDSTEPGLAGDHRSRL